MQIFLLLILAAR